MKTDTACNGAETSAGHGDGQFLPLWHSHQLWAQHSKGGCISLRIDLPLSSAIVRPQLLR